jgi:hypothetical protein
MLVHQRTSNPSSYILPRDSQSQLRSNKLQSRTASCQLVGSFVSSYPSVPGELSVLRISVCDKWLTVFIHEGLTCLHIYLLFPDIARVQNVRVKLEAPFVLKRFVPVSNDVLQEKLDLSQFQVVISDSMDMCVRFQTAVLQVSGYTICSSVILKCSLLMNVELTQMQIPYS